HLLQPESVKRPADANGGPRRPDRTRTHGGSNMNIAYPAQLDKYQTIAAAISLLAELYPKCFSVYEGRRRPLKLGIHLDIQAALDGAITPAELHRALGFYCSNPAYLAQTRKGAWRVDLNGEPAGAVTDDEEAHARETLTRIETKKA